MVRDARVRPTIADPPGLASGGRAAMAAPPSCPAVPSARRRSSPRCCHTWRSGGRSSPAAQVCKDGAVNLPHSFFRFYFRDRIPTDGGAIVLLPASTPRPPRLRGGRPGEALVQHAVAAPAYKAAGRGATPSFRRRPVCIAFVIIQHTKHTISAIRMDPAPTAAPAAARARERAGQHAREGPVHREVVRVHVAAVGEAGVQLRPKRMEISKFVMQSSKGTECS